MRSTDVMIVRAMMMGMMDMVLYVNIHPLPKRGVVTLQQYIAVALPLKMLCVHSER